MAPRGRLDLPDFALRVGRPRPGRSPARAAARASHVGARCRHVHQAHPDRARGRRARHRGGRAERRRRPGRGVGARLRAGHSRPGARLAGLQGQALRPVCAPRAGDHAQAARQLLRQLVRQIAVPHARSRADRVLRRRSADRAAHRGQHPPRALRHGGPHRRGRARHHHSDAAADLGRGLRRPSRTAASFLRAPRYADQRASRAAGLYHDIRREIARSRFSTRAASCWRGSTSR